MTALMLDADPSAAFTTLYLQQLARVRHLAARRVMNGDQALAEDISQEAFLRLWRYLSDGHEVGNAEALLTTLTCRAAADHYRLARNTRERAADFADPVTSMRLPGVRSAEDVAVARETVRETVAAGFGGVL
jgi:DNA-directed RNA polymerase specialized sigma24 family protein